MKKITKALGMGQRLETTVPWAILRVLVGSGSISAAFDFDQQPFKATIFCSKVPLVKMH